jgi:hypothetical protein
MDTMADRFAKEAALEGGRGAFKDTLICMFKSEGDISWGLMRSAG